MTSDEKPAVLVVDDNEATCTLLSAVLHRDYRVEIAMDGLEALERLKSNRYAAVLLDMRMPHLDGYGVLEFIRTHNPEALARVIVVTASMTARELERVKDFPVCDVVSKPFDVEVLLTAVKSCTGGSSKPIGLFLTNGVLLLLADLLRHRIG